MKTSLFAFLLFIVVAVSSRFMPWIPNFSPLMGLVFFAGAYFASRKTALIAIFATLVLSDLYLGFYESMWITYIGFAAMALIGNLFLSQWSKRSLDNFIPCWAFGSLFSATAFFLISNFGVWFEGVLYPKDLSGLWTAYVMGLPFFKYTLISTAVFSAAAFGAVYWAQGFRKVLKQEN